MNEQNPGKQRVAPREPKTRPVSPGGGAWNWRPGYPVGRAGFTPEATGPAPAGGIGNFRGIAPSSYRPWAQAREMAEAAERPVP